MYGALHVTVGDNGVVRLTGSLQAFLESGFLGLYFYRIGDLTLREKEGERFVSTCAVIDAP